MSDKPESQAREEIDRLLTAAGWHARPEDLIKAFCTSCYTRQTVAINMISAGTDNRPN